MRRSGLSDRAGVFANVAIVACLAWAAPACAPVVTPPPKAVAPPAPPDTSAADTAAFVPVEEAALQWIAASDPRLAVRSGATTTDDVLKQIGMAAVMAEDASAQIHGGSLDLFAFAARARALDEAAKLLGDFTRPLPDGAPAGAAIARPRLEQELLARFVDEERGRTADEAQLAESSGDIVRAIVATWSPPSVPEDWPNRDVWATKHLHEIRESITAGRPWTAPLDLDAALYPLERLLAPLQFPRASAAMAQLRVALDDMRGVPTLASPERLAREMKLHLGVVADPSSLRARLDTVEARLRTQAEQALAASVDGRPVIQRRARELLFVDKACPAVASTRVRTMAPPPERAPICGLLQAFADEPAAAIVALHDDVLFAVSAISTAPPPRTQLLSSPEDDVVEGLRRRAREHPVEALGVALAAEIIEASATPEARAAAWRALGEAPLDVVARELR